MNGHPVASRFVAMLALVAPSLAQADNIWCVNNVASFQQALDSARDDDTTIRLWRGEYVASFIDVDDIDHDLTILGGYSDANCSEAGRSLDPGLTVFHPATGGAYGFALSADHPLLIKSITFRGYAKGLFIEGADLDNGADVTLDRVRIERSGGAFSGQQHHRALELGGVFGLDAATLRQVVIADNTSGSGDCAASIHSEHDAVVVQSTFANNAGTALCIEAGQSTDPHADIDNNVFWGNECGLDVSGVPGTALHMRHNTIDCNTFDELPSISIGNNSLDPQFVGAANGDYRLLLTSPAVDTGINPPTGGQPATDIVGNPRVIGASVDRGPWETDLSNATILVVGNTNGSGAGSLANAIAQSNNLPGTQVIRFNIPGTCPRVITQAQGQPLPDITDNVRIEGFSQPGSVAGAPAARTICVGVWGNQQLPALLRVPVDADASLDVSGLGFGGTTLDAGAAAIVLLGGGGHQIGASQFGGSIGPAGNPVLLNVLQNGIVAGFGAHDGTIGGLDAEQGNVFNSARTAAIDIGATSTQPAAFRVYNNFIGVKPDGIGTDANGTGIGMGNSNGNFVLNNWIGGNTSDGIVLRSGADDNVIVANDIGRCPSCLAPPFGSESLLGNGLHGVLVRSGASGNIVNGNRIAGNGFGIAEEAGANANPLVGNRIYRNGGLGIDIGRDGVTPNDGGGIDPDGVQNFPLLVTAGGGFYAGVVHGSLNAAAERSYAIDLYASDSCDASGYGEGQRLVGHGTVTTPPTPVPGLHSSASFAFAIESTGLDGKAITAIARGPAGDTSEFSPCIDYVYSDVIFQNGFD